MVKSSRTGRTHDSTKAGSELVSWNALAGQSDTHDAHCDGVGYRSTRKAVGKYRMQTSATPSAMITRSGRPGSRPDGKLSTRYVIHTSTGQPASLPMLCTTSFPDDDNIARK